MASFTDLPPELVQRIIHNVKGFDIESLTLSCKSLYGLGEKRLQEHRALRDEYSDYGRRFKSLPDLLDAMLQDNNISIYTRELIIPSRPTNLMRNGESGDFITHPSFSQARQDRFRNLLWSYGNDWVESVLSGNEEPIATTLLNSLPGLYHLMIGNRYRLDSPGSVYTFLKKLPAFNARALSRLTRVTLLQPDTGRAGIDGAISDRPEYRRENPDRVVLFSEIPSVKMITACGVYTSTTQHPPKRYLLPKSSDLECLQFKYTAIHPDHLTPLLQGFKALRTFQLDNQELFMLPEYIRAIRTSLVATARTTLENLSLRFSPPERTCLGSFRAFSTLRTIDVNINSLVDRLGRDNQLALAKVLPISLQKLTLRFGNTFCWIASGKSRPRVGNMVLGLSTSKLEGFHQQLQEINLVTERGVRDFDGDGPYSYADLQELLKGNEITFSVHTQDFEFGADGLFKGK